MATERIVDVNELVRLLRIQARQEVEQTRINLDRELKEWKARYGKICSKYARLRMHNRELREKIRKSESKTIAGKSYLATAAGIVAAEMPIDAIARSGRGGA